jgi:hypothetical protein
LPDGYGRQAGTTYRGRFGRVSKHIFVKLATNNLERVDVAVIGRRISVLPGEISNRTGYGLRSQQKP